MPDSTTADISRTLRKRLKEGGSWRVPDRKTARRSEKTDPVGGALPAPSLRAPMLVGGTLVVLVTGAALIVLLASTRPPTLANPVLQTPPQNDVPTAAMPELWLTPSVTRDAPGLVDTRPTAVAAAVESHPAPLPPPVPVVSVPPPAVAIQASGAITTTTEHLGNLTVDAQLTQAIAFGVEQRVEISARSDNAPLVGAHVSLRVANSFGTSMQVAPDTDRSGRSSQAWRTYRSVGLNQVRVLVSSADGRQLSAQLAFLGASSED